MGKKVTECNFLLSPVASIFLNWKWKGKEKEGLTCKEQVNTMMGKKLDQQYQKTLVTFGEQQVRYLSKWHYLSFPVEKDGCYWTQ